MPIKPFYAVTGQAVAVFVLVGVLAVMTLGAYLVARLLVLVMP
jgi:hypothetical protein